MEKIRIGLIIGSTREGRFASHAASWFAGLTAAQSDIELEIIDLKDHPLPFFTDAVSPAWKGGVHIDPAVQAFAEKIKALDGFIMTAAEYNHGYTAVLKNALDTIYLEWNNKPVGFIGYGSVGGGRAVEQLRQVAIELQMAPVRNGVHINAPWLLRKEDGSLQAGALDTYSENAMNMLTQLIWWAKALKAGRAA